MVWLQYAATRILFPILFYRNPSRCTYREPCQVAGCCMEVGPDAGPSLGQGFRACARAVVHGSAQLPASP